MGDDGHNDLRIGDSEEYVGVSKPKNGSEETRNASKNATGTEGKRCRFSILHGILTNRREIKTI